jgi:hypothetical protein
MSSNNFLISVVRKGVVVALHWSHKLRELATIRAMHPGCDIEIADMTGGKPIFDEPQVDEPKPRHYRCKVRCIETGKEFKSIKDCCATNGYNAQTLYLAIKHGTDIGGYHYEYIPNERIIKKTKL